MKSEEIQKEIIKFAEDNNLTVTKYMAAIAEAKRRIGGDWRLCPCHREGKHFCGSEICMNEINTNGVCGCNLFKKGA